MKMARRELASYDCVYRRAGHVMVAYENKLYLWGGYMEEPHTIKYNQITRNSTAYHPPDEIWVYEPLIDTWSRKICQGDTPYGLSGASAAICGDYMYLFGGFIGYGDSSEIMTNKLWALFLPSLTWKILSPSGFKPFCCDKSSSWIYQNKFYIFGGFGCEMPEISHAPSQVSFALEDNVPEIRGWIDQLAYYDIDANSWVWPNVRGEKPSPRAAHATAVLKDKAYIFGGRHRDQRLNDFYSLDLNSHVFSKTIYQNPFIPCGRSWHSLSPVSHDKLVLYGGFSTFCEPLNDVWMFFPINSEWYKLPKPQPKPRLWHAASSTKKGELVVVGGISANILGDLPEQGHADDMVRLRFSPPSLLMLTLEYVSNTLPRDTWKNLPQSIIEILTYRNDDKHVHGRFSWSRPSTLTFD